MDFKDQLQPVITGIIDNLKVTIESELRAQINSTVISKLADLEINTAVADAIQRNLQSKINQTDFLELGRQQLSGIVKQISDGINKNLVQGVNQQISEDLKKQMAAIDTKAMINEVIQSRLATLMQDYNFPDKSIPSNSIDWTDTSISGDNISGGIIKNFGSTGIEDRASFVQLTLMDHASAFEGPLYTPEMVVAGNLTVNGTVTLKGDLDLTGDGIKQLVSAAGQSALSGLTDQLYKDFSYFVYNQINTQGLDLDRLTQGGKDIVKGNQLGYQITDTNIQRLGIVKDLQTSGETLLVNTLYVANDRVGINTLEPSSALTVWDQEFEFLVYKRKYDTGYIGTNRPQTMILGSNGQESIILTPDGQVRIDNFKIKNTVQTTEPGMPSYEANKGTIAWNENPELGGVIGYVCLGGTRWAGFGRIE
jgi:hypothetical protein